MTIKIDIYGNQRRQLEQLDTPFNLDRFITWHGFDVFELSSFLDEFVGQEDDMSDMERCEKLWGKEVADLIGDAINSPTTAFPHNWGLRNVRSGAKGTYWITKASKRGIVTFEQFEGYIYYPFAVRKRFDNCWGIDHLPTGYWATGSSTKKACVNAIKDLFSLFPNAPDVLDSVTLTSCNTSGEWDMLLELRKLILD